MAVSEVAIPVAPVTESPPDSLGRRLLRQRNAQLGLGLLSLYAFVIVLGPFLVHGNPSSDPNFQALIDALQPPSGRHPIGTDDFGRDELVRLVEGGRFTLLIGFAAVAVGLLVGVPLGAISGHFKGWVDMLVQRAVDIVLAFPGFLLALALIAVLGPGLRNVIISVGVTSFPRFVRVLRAGVLTVREYPFIEAAHALGVSSWRVLWRHNLPNALAPVIVQTPLELGSAILTAAGLGFLGLGVAQPTPEWGSMLGEGRQFLFTDSGLVTYPGLAIVGVILAFNLVGDGLRDVLDPRQRGRS